MGGAMIDEADKHDKFGTNEHGECELCLTAKLKERLSEHDQAPMTERRLAYAAEQASYDTILGAVHDDLSCSECRDDDGPCDCTGYHARIAIDCLRGELDQVRTILSARDEEYTVEAARRTVVASNVYLESNHLTGAALEEMEKRAEAAEKALDDVLRSQREAVHAGQTVASVPGSAWDIVAQDRDEWKRRAEAAEARVKELEAANLDECCRGDRLQEELDEAVAWQKAKAEWIEAAEARVKELEDRDSHATRFTYTGPGGKYDAFQCGDTEWGIMSHAGGVLDRYGYARDAAIAEAKRRAGVT